MTLHAGLAVVAAFTLMAGPDRPKKESKPAPSQAQWMNGCLDQRGSGYVLTGEAMKIQATLSGGSLSEDNLARYIGHRVTVHGEIDRSRGLPAIRVSRVEEISATCR